jgi:hypothetical protein
MSTRSQTIREYVHTILPAINSSQVFGRSPRLLSAHCLPLEKVVLHMCANNFYQILAEGTIVITARRQAPLTSDQAELCFTSHKIQNKADTFGPESSSAVEVWSESDVRLYQDAHLVLGHLRGSSNDCLFYRRHRHLMCVMTITLRQTRLNCALPTRPLIRTAVNGIVATSATTKMWHCMTALIDTS